ncbi:MULTISPECIES: GLTT repeat protein [unclassified Prochlorococcus]|uniref:GLTT repeat protein n=1 Tax=unclassified Prochlorococcus TaxID=2627481 RepID=UPI00053387F2|nr:MULTISPECIES: GLTT repeat protein [unclassified Prochlorococcus]KGG15594.1 hypothetical protein EV06_1468 [Prochlorococcus sp. MIT 0602]KGG17874.1 hypothetical protein EV07_1317 [Prochlorococcus sp. MIT 0603]
MTSLKSPDLDNSEAPSHCGSKPKKVAIGIAPLGIVSIGVVPMGIITIGIVPMGVVSLGVVAMGVVNASIVGMGIFSAGITTMGLKVWSPESAALEQTIDDPGASSLKNIYAYPSRARAQIEARKLGCSGIHKMGNLWMPCATHRNNE